MEKVQIFQDKKVRTHWDAEKEEWYFSVVDVVGVLTDSMNPTDYLKKMRKRDPELAAFIGTNCPQVDMLTEAGKRRKTLAADSKAVFRIIQSIPSPKAEPFKQCLSTIVRGCRCNISTSKHSIRNSAVGYNWQRWCSLCFF